MYPQDQVIFDVQELRQVTAEDIYRWAKFRVYGDPDTDETVTPPVNYRHSTVFAWKKGISHFMSNGHLQWNEEHSSGIPPSLASLPASSGI